MIQLLDRTFAELGRRQHLISLEWTTEFAGPGEFRAVLPLDEWPGLEGAHFVVNELTGQTGAIDRVRRRFDRQLGGLAEISGRMLESLLDRRVIERRKRLTGTAEEVARQLVEEFAIDYPRTIRGLSLGSQANDYHDIDVDVERGQTLMEAVYPILGSRGRTFRIRREGTNLWFDIWRGKDRTAAQSTNSPIRIAQDAQNGLAAEYVDDYDKRYTVILVVKDQVVELTRTIPGEDRRELYIDGPDASDYLTTEGYRKALQRYGWQKLSEISAPAALLVAFPQEFPLKLGVDLALGDLVDLSFPTLGVENSLRLTRLTMTAESGRVNWKGLFSPDVLNENESSVL